MGLEHEQYAILNQPKFLPLALKCTCPCTSRFVQFVTCFSCSARSLAAVAATIISLHSRYCWLRSTPELLLLLSLVLSGAAHTSPRAAEILRTASVDSITNHTLRRFNKRRVHHQPSNGFKLFWQLPCLVTCFGTPAENQTENKVNWVARLLLLRTAFLNQSTGTYN